MNKKILLTMLLALIVVMSISAIQASDVNITDSNALGSSDDVIQLESESQTSDDVIQLEGESRASDDVIQLEGESQASGAESDTSNTLSTNNKEIVLEETSKNQTKLTATTTKVYYKGSYKVVLKDSNTNKVLANKNVTFVINKVKHVIKTDSNGIASLPCKLKPGKYTVSAYFTGDNTFEASNKLTSTLKVLSTIKASDIIKYYKGSAQYTATFYDSYGKALANKNVVISVNGKSYTRKTNSKGVVSLPLDLNPGTYKVISTNPVNGYKLTTTFKVLPTIKASNIYKVIGDNNKRFTAKFYKSNGKALANKYIKFELDGKTYKVKTNSYGNAKLSIKDIDKGKHYIVCYNKDGFSKTYKIKVYSSVSTKLKTKDYTFLTGDSVKKIKARLIDDLGHVPPSGMIVKINFNGNEYTKETNSDGVVSLKLPSLKKGVYIVRYTFDGTSNYKASKVHKVVTVLSTKNSVLTVKSTRTFGYGAGTPLKVQATAGGVALVKRVMTFNVDGKTYIKTTDYDGIASLPIELAIGHYTVKYSINKESKLKAKSASVPIKVKKRDASKIIWKGATSFKDSPQIIKVFLADKNGKAISGQTVKVIINSKKYFATTAPNGCAKIKAYIPIGKYNVKVKFVGSNDYLASSTSKSIKVTVSNYINGVIEKNTIKDLRAYLKSSSNCQVGNSKIKSLVKSLTKGLTSDYDKAEAIFNYVRDSISYSFYYDTNYGALGTLNAGSGNCVDQAHLLVAMYRTAGLSSRYVHGSCTFSSGSTYGHVWSQVLIGDTWVCADATSVRNSFGKIVNWNTGSFSLNSRYASLPF